MPKRTTRTRRRTKAEREFVSEAEEILEVLRGGVADLSESLGSDAEVDPELVNALFRAAHSLKALAGMFRRGEIENLAHRLEDLLDALRLGRAALTGDVVVLIDECVAVFAAVLDAVGNESALAEAAAPAAVLETRIAEAIVAPARSRAEVTSLGIDPAILRSLTEYEEHRLEENLRRGRGLFLASALFDMMEFEAGLTALTDAMRSEGEVISTLPAAGDVPEGQIRFSLLVATEAAQDALTAALGELDATLEPVRGATGASPPVSETKTQPVPQAPGPNVESLQSLGETVRVDIRKLDELMNLVGELVISRRSIGELVRRLEITADDRRLVGDFAKAQKSLDRKVRQMQSAVLDARMVPLRQIFDKLHRVVRRLSQDLQKPVDLEIRGAETELDKLIVEGLVDPLMHVLRNALDHGIEPSEARTGAGKPERGQVSIEAFQRGSHVVIAVADDGQGIDREALRAKAIERELVTATDELGEREALELIFAPGLSTSEEVTETSGRGVGMDVVRANLTELGGAIEIDSELGRGTTITLTLPITLAIVPSLVVGIGEQRFAIPLSSVLETLSLDPAAIQVSEHNRFLHLRGDPLRLCWLSDVYGIPVHCDPQESFVVVAGVGDQRVGLVVDRVEGQQDTVIKPIQGPVAHIHGIAGATEVGDQDPVLVLDVSALLDDGPRRREAA
ncbi:MAG: chemotaxis protein CheA [Myxococcota bacterium]